MSFLALVPQFQLWILRGSDWQGTYVSFDFDEVAYGSYLNALIDGRPRRNDPYTGRDDLLTLPRAESLHSIQFIPAYAVALPARAFGLSAGTTLVVIRVLSAFAATLALFWLLLLITNDSRLAVAGAIVVLCLGGIAGEPHHAWRIFTLRGTTDSLPFLRGYVPALVFPLFFIFIAFVWQGLQSERPQPRLRYAAFAGLILSVLIFSYFFLWTAAVAWLFAITLLWLGAHWGAKGETNLVFGVVLGCLALTLIPYAYLLSQRAKTIDAAQLLTHSYAPIISLPVIIGLIVLLALLLAVRWGWLSWRTPEVLFTASFALLPGITFNQQLVTGLLLQPVHYSRYVANYASVLAAFLAAILIWRCEQQERTSRRQASRLLFLVTLMVFGWALGETAARSARLSRQFYERDDAQRVAWRLRELAGQSAIANPHAKAVVFCSDLLLGDSLPNVAPQPILWAPHLFVFSGASAEENRQRLYQQLYYSGVGEEEFAASAGKSSFLQLAIFGWERMNEKAHAPVITSEDVRRETLTYAEFTRAFDASRAATPRVEYVVVPATGGPSLANLDRWYERDTGQRVGNYVLYQVRLR